MAASRAGHRTNWHKLKARYLAHEWANIKEMSEQLGISEWALRKHSKGWPDERDRMDKEADENAYELIVQDRTHLIHKHELQVYDMGQSLLMKAAKRLLGKVKKEITDEKTGEVKTIWVDREFESDSTALVATRLAIVMIQSVIKPDGGGNGAPAVPGSPMFGLPNTINLGPDGTPQLTKMSVRQFTPEELTAIIKAPMDEIDERVKKMAAKATK